MTEHSTDLTHPSPQPTRTPSPRGLNLFARRWSLRVTLLTLVTALLLAMATATGVVWLASTRRSFQTLEARQFRLAADNVAEQIRSQFTPVERMLQETPAFVRRGIVVVDPPDYTELGSYLYERLTVHSELAFISFLDPVHRTALMAERLADNSQILVRLGLDANGEPRRQVLVGTDQARQTPGQPPGSMPFAGGDAGWMRDAWRSDGVVWTDPYTLQGGFRGITAARRLTVEGQIEPIGVLAVDFPGATLDRFLNIALREAWSQAFLVNARGDIVGYAGSEPLPVAQSTLRAVLATTRRDLSRLAAREPEFVSVTLSNERYLAGLDRVTVGQIDWILVLIEPEDRVLGEVYNIMRDAVVVGIGCLALAIVAGVVVANAVSRPLRLISVDLERVGRFELDDQPPPQSHIHEVHVVGRALVGMKTNLASFGRYVPSEIVRELVTTGREARLGGDLRDLTIFFSDVAGFTRISEQMAPNALVAHLAEYLTEMSAQLIARGGVIDKFIGDGIVAFFNAPHAVADHPIAACLAALASRDRLAALREQWRVQGKPPFHARIGIHRGDVVVGNFGTPDRFQYTMIGDAVNVASRLEGLGKLYGAEIIVSDTVRAATGDRFQWRRLDYVVVAGHQQPVMIFELLGETGSVEPARFAAARAYEAAWDQYRARDFSAAAEAFRQVGVSQPDDVAAQLLATRATINSIVPPPPEWNGAFSLNDK